MANQTTPAIQVKDSNVGIGIASPAQKLHVGGIARVSDGIIVDSGQVLQLDHNYAVHGYLKYSSSTFGTETEFGMYGYYGINLYTRQGSGLVIRGDSNNVGIGTTSPAAKLDVNGTFNSSGTVSGAGLRSNNIGGATTSGTGWFKIAKVDSRGGGVIKLSFTGGSYGPITYVIKYHKDWASTTTLKLEKYGASNYITDVRFIQDDSDSKYYIEFLTASDTLSFQVYHDWTLGYNASTTMYTGTLSAGASSGTTTSSLPFITYGTSTHYQHVSSALGVGTTSPANKLHIKTSDNTSYGLIFENSSASTAFVGFSAQWDFDVNSGGAGGNWLNLKGGATGSSGGIKMYTLNTERVRITSAGNVGINTTSPGSTLDIVSSGINIYRATDTGGQYRWRVDQNFDMFMTNSAGADKSGIKNDGSAYFLGNVGIGTTSPDYNLKVTGATWSDYIIAGSDSTYGDPYRTVAFGNVGNGNNRILASRTTSDGMYFMAATGQGFNFRPNGGTANLVVINSSGNVGVGTSSPEGGLHVASSSSGGIGGQIVIDNPAGSTLGNTAEISFLTDAGASGTGTRNARILAVNENAGNGAANMQFHTWNGAASAERMRITSGGNVGIGTTSPVRKLHVSTGNTDIAARFENTTSNSTVMELLTSGDGKTMYFQTDHIYVSSGSMHFGNDTGDIYLRTSTAGGVGIGTTSPANTLHTYGASGSSIAIDAGGTNNSGLQFKTAGTLTAAITYVPSTSQMHFYRGGDVMVVGGNNVGIGTTTPVSRLHVAGRIAGGELGNPNITRNGLTLYLDFNDKACHSGGSEAPIDLSPSNYTIGITGGANFEYKDGIGVYYFDDSSDHIDVTNFYRGDTGVTYEAWVYANALSSWDTVFDSGTERPLIGFLSGQLRAYPANETFFTATTGRWYHIAFAFASDSDLDVYVNGYRVSDGYDWSNGGTWTSRSGTFNLWIGGDNSTETFNGYIAIARTYNRQLQPQELLQNYNAEVSRFATVTPALGINHSYDNVGIGISSPGAKLHVVGGSGGISGTGITYLNNTDDAFSLVVNNAGNSSQNDRGVFEARVNSSSVFRINNSGNVGIGTTSPASNLHVNSASAGNNIFILGVAGQEQFAFQAGISGVTNAALRITETTNDYDYITLRSGNVGIGTTSPSAKLHVAGDVKVGGTATYNTINIYNNAASGGSGVVGYQNDAAVAYFGTAGWYTGTTDTGVVIGTDSSSRPIRFYTNTERMRITGGGNVGIGTTSPGAKLEVNGTGVAAAATLKINTSSSSTFVHSQENMAANLTSGQHNILVIGQRTNTKNSGYIGYYWAGDASNSNFVTIGHWGVDDIFRVYGNSTVTMSGNVGIGTTSPAYTLDVNGSAGIYGDLNFTKADGVGINAKESLIITIDSDNNDTGRVFQIKEGSGNTLMVVQEAGNVGIGTTSPESYYSHKLVVNAGNEDGITIVGGTSDINYLMFADGTAGNARYRGMVWYNHSIDMMGFSTSGSNRMYIDATGNVGIGTSSPSEKLEVTSGNVKVGNNYLFGWRYSSADSNMYNYIYSSYDDTTTGIAYRSGSWTSNQDIVAHNFQTYSGGWTSRLAILQNGNVGIGTTSPEGKLDVVGSTINGTQQSDWSSDGISYNDYGDLTISKRHGATKNSVWGFTGPLVDFRSSNSSHEWSVAQIMGTVDSFNGTNHQGGLMFLTSGGGSTDPTGRRTAGAAPQVRMAIGATGQVYIQGSVGIGTTGIESRLHVQETNAGSSGGILYLKNSSETAGTYTGIHFGTWGKKSGIFHKQGSYGGYGTGDLIFATNSTLDGTVVSPSDARMVITNPGNVGIGNTGPSYKLDVSGGIRATDYFISSAGATIGGQGPYDWVFLGPQGDAASRAAAVMIGDINGAKYAVYGGSYDLAFAKHRSDTDTFHPALTILGSSATDSSPDVYITNSLGIGTNSPSQKLSVYGNIYLRGGDCITWSNGDAQIDSTSYHLRFHTYDGVSALVERMRITSGGNVGFGTTSPSYKIDVSGGAIAIRGNAAGNSLRFDDSLGTSRNAMYVDTSNYLNVGNANYAGLKLYHTASETPSTNGYAGENIAEAFGSITNNRILAEPSAWLEVRVGTTDYVIPMYTTG